MFILGLHNKLHVMIVVAIFHLLSSVKRHINSYSFKRFILCREGQQSYRHTQFSAECDEGGGRFSTLYSHTQVYWVTIVHSIFLTWHTRKSFALHTHKISIKLIFLNMIMRILSVNPVLWLVVNLHHVLSDGAAFNTQSHISQIS